MKTIVQSQYVFERCFRESNAASNGYKQCSYMEKYARMTKHRRFPIDSREKRHYRHYVEYEQRLAIIESEF